MVLCGSGHADFDLAKLSHDVCLMSIQVRRNEREIEQRRKEEKKRRGRDEKRKR